MRNVLEVRELTQQFERKVQGMSQIFTAVDHVTFSLQEGKVLGIVGESGSGKSTLARCIMGVGQNPAGSVMIDGVDMITASSRDRKKAYLSMQMVFQDPVGSFNPRKTLGYSIGESLKNQGLNRKEIEIQVKRLLGECGLTEEFANRYPYEVSGGQAQRAAIARALAVEPSVIICDEATSALDVTIQKQVIELLQKLTKEKNVAIIFICHNLALVQSFCDRVLVMQNGKVIESGYTAEVIANPKEEYTKSLIDAAISVI